MPTSLFCVAPCLCRAHSKWSCITSMRQRCAVNSAHQSISARIPVFTPIMCNAPGWCSVCSRAPCTCPPAFADGEVFRGPGKERVITMDGAKKAQWRAGYQSECIQVVWGTRVHTGAGLYLTMCGSHAASQVLRWDDFPSNHQVRKREAGLSAAQGRWPALKGCAAGRVSRQDEAARGG